MKMPLTFIRFKLCRMPQKGELEKKIKNKKLSVTDLN